MGQILLFVIATVIIGVGFALLVSQREAKKHGTSAVKELVGICQTALERNSQKEVRNFLPAFLA